VLTAILAVSGCTAVRSEEDETASCSDGYAGVFHAPCDAGGDVPADARPPVPPKDRPDVPLEPPPDVPLDGADDNSVECIFGDLDTDADVPDEPSGYRCDPVTDFRRSMGSDLYECGTEHLDGYEVKECSHGAVTCLDLHWQRCLPAHMQQRWSFLDSGLQADFFVQPTTEGCRLVVFVDTRGADSIDVQGVSRVDAVAVDFGDDLGCRNQLTLEPVGASQVLGGCGEGFDACPACEDGWPDPVPCDDAFDCPGTSACSASGRTCECGASSAASDPWCHLSGFGCASDAECEPSATCRDGACTCASDASCPAGKVCNGEGRCVLCASDADCGDGLFCDQFDKCVIR